MGKMQTWSAVAVLNISAFPGQAHAGTFTFLRPATVPGVVTETTTASNATVMIWPTDNAGAVIPANPNNPGWPRTATIGTEPGLKNSASFSIPQNVPGPALGSVIPVIDVRQTVTINKASGETSDLMIEAVFFDTGTNQYVLGNIFGTIAESVGILQQVLIPDLFADTNGDGSLDSGDVLYSLVDLSVYLNSIPSFTLGESFNIVNGAVAGLPGMEFSTTPFTFDPNTGFSDPSFTGTGFALGEHDPVATPEPSSLFLAAGPIALLGLVLYGRRRCTAGRNNDPTSTYRCHALA